MLLLRHAWEFPAGDIGLVIGVRFDGFIVGFEMIIILLFLYLP